MNWRVSFLDRYRLTSNSDAHSPSKLGREATLFACEPDYFSIRRALESGAGYGGTVEFFPEEGKYHLDGHRKCDIRLEPKETLALGGRCPVCGETLTIGVAHRVEMLADRDEAEAKPPATAGAVASLVPLPEVISEIVGTGPSSKKVAHSYGQAVARLGPELSILQDLPVEEVASADPLLGEAVTRLRAGAVRREAGYDGEYGVIRLFEEGELKRLSGAALLFDAPILKRKKPARRKPANPPSAAPEAPASETIAVRQTIDPKGGLLAGLDEDQAAAVAHVGRPLAIVAGPGSGKTRVLTRRIAHLVGDCAVAPENCLAITFTRRAAAEMRERLTELLPEATKRLPIHTFHSLGLAILKEQTEPAGLAPGFRLASAEERTGLLAESLQVTPHKAAGLIERIARDKRLGRCRDGEPAEILDSYVRAMDARGWIDFDDLIHRPAALLAHDATLRDSYRARFAFVSVDEFQDVDAAQYRLLKLLAPADGNLAVIGDPDQAIYGFRGGDASAFARFRADYPSAAMLRLARNYRSTGTIVTASAQVIAGGAAPVAEVVREMHERITIHAAASDKAEAEFVVASIEGLIGGHSFFSLDSGRGGLGAAGALGFADFAVLYRTTAQSAALVEALARSGIPFKTGTAAPIGERPAVQALLHELDTVAAGTPLAAALAAAAERLRGPETDFDAAALDQALRWLTALAGTSGDEPTRFREAVALANEADFFDPRADRVSLITMHAAKGLEFPVVFVVGLEDGIMPLRFGSAEAEAIAEERRLLYVAMTRAKDRLFLTRASERPWRGKPRQLAPSPFLEEIETELLQHEKLPPMRRLPTAEQLSLF